MPRSKFTKYSIPKHQRDRLLLEEQRKIIEKLQKETVWLRSYVELETRFSEQVETSFNLGNGCYRKRSLKVDY